jgi:lipoprotein signal peptidase
MAADHRAVADNHNEAVVLRSADAVAIARAGAGAGAVRQASLLAVVFVVVVSTDQIVKWWAWQHIDGSLINSGGFILLGPNIRSWFADPVSGAAADVVGGLLVMTAVGRLLRQHRPIPVLLGGGMVAAGLLSSVFDRIGLHNWTAPGSARGVVDFIPDIGPGRYNVADLWIGVGALLLGYAFARRRLTDAPRGHGGIESRSMRLSRAPRARACLAAVIVFGTFLALAVISGVDYGGVQSPSVK